MIGLSWNCRGLRNPHTVRELHRLVKTKCPNFVFLIETKCGRNKVEEIRNKVGFDSSFVIDSKGFSGGLAFLWNSSDNFNLESYSQQHISLNLKKEEVNTEIQFTGFYGSPYTAKRTDSWNLMKMLQPRQDKPWFCFGDFNEILHQHEKKGAALRPYNQMEEFRETMEACGLFDCGFQGQKYTWNNNREGNLFTKERLDRAMGNLPLIRIFSEISIYGQVAYSSDHCPLVINMGSEERLAVLLERRREKMFRYEASWNLRDECSNLINTNWSQQQEGEGNQMRLVQQNLLKCKEGLIQWSRTTLRHNNREIQRKLN
ncbi:uncharacterized protein LOC122274455 [Carya illinoinensis]|uniref:uncharacterized protein LOC122274455 n=1 Tax=Carya illinoinensis TaxID=32201 RepID=UPI001C71F84F|nr:uncharacterized protein LOC122274455 [Carya illinoinensis]